MSRLTPLSLSGDAGQRAAGLPRNALLCVVGARPNFMKIAPIMAALRAPDCPIPACLVHTGQHYDEDMKDAFFNQLGIPEPDVDLEVGSASHAVQTAEIMRRFEPVIDAVDPSGILVVGDVNSTIACALVAVKKGVPVIHVEAGLRSFDRAMPEEINRILTDQISELLFTTERTAHANLVREGIDEQRIHFVGNVMIDTLFGHRAKAIPTAKTLARYADAKAVATCGDSYAVLTLHRPSNVDDPFVLERLIDTVVCLSHDVPVVFPVHPRTRAVLQKAGLLKKLSAAPRLWMLPPVGYLEMLGLMAGAQMVLTDSGGMQEETTALGVPCITLRSNTERPITIDQGTNTIAGSDADTILSVARDVLASGGKAGRIPEKWDGRAAERIRDVLVVWQEDRRQSGAGRV